MNDKLSKALARTRYGATGKFPYFTTQLFALTPVETPLVRLAAVDEWWRLYLNPVTFVAQPHSKRMWLLFHEMFHPLRMHFERARLIGVTKETSLIWNIAADAEMFHFLTKTMGLDPPEGVVIPEELGLEVGLLAETYYRQLLPRKEELEKMYGDGLTGAGEGGSGVSGQASPWELPGDSTVPKVTPEEMRGFIREIISRMREQGWGNEAAGMELFIDEIATSEVDWRTLVHAEATKVSDEVRSGGMDYSYRRINRRSPPDGILFPALVDYLPNLGIVIDTSGSMTGLMEQAVGEVRGICEHLASGIPVPVICVDAAAYQVQTIFGTGNFSVQLQGGGGTDMRIGIEYFANQFPPPDICFVVTDGQTPWPSEPPMHMKVVVVLIGRDAPDAPDWTRQIRVRE